MHEDKFGNTNGLIRLMDLPEELWVLAISNRHLGHLPTKLKVVLMKTTESTETILVRMTNSSNEASIGVDPIDMNTDANNQKEIGTQGMSTMIQKEPDEHGQTREEVRDTMIETTNQTTEEKGIVMHGGIRICEDSIVGTLTQDQRIGTGITAVHIL